MVQTVIQDLNEKAINDDYLYKLLKKIQFRYGCQLLGIDTENLNEKEFLDVLRFADILSRSTKSFNRNIALKIISTLFDEYQGDTSYQLFAQNVMVKLGNFPSLKLLEKMDVQFDNNEIQLDKLSKQIFQQTSIENQYFTDSQYEAFQEITNSNHYSFSAGTSFGKSFLFAEYVNWLIEEKNASENIAFLVPTRALITQVTVDLKGYIKNDNYRIISNPDIPAIFRNKKFIFVFTPERLVSYFSNSKSPNISTMIVDEAQNIISYDERSPMFYHAITLAEQKSINLYFASPNVPNPELFLELVGNSTDESKQITDVNVVQNKFLIDFVEKKVNLYYDFLKETKFDETQLKFDNFEDLLETMTTSSQSIIYCNSVHNIVERAQKFVVRLNKIDNDELMSLSKCIRETIHDDYYLADLVEKGIGFHFGALPQELREKVEQQFKKGNIKYLFTTSTLLQGVNLPAKNLFILSERIGLSKLTILDFKNLAGRAGRLSKELYGNLFVVRDLDGKRESSLNELLEIDEVPKVESYVLEGKKNFYKNIGNVINDKPMTNKSMSEKRKRMIADYATIMTYQYKKNVTSQLREQFNRKNSAQSNEVFKKIADYSIPNEVLMLSTTIKPKYQERVFKETEHYEFELKTEYKDCLEILKVLNEKYDWQIEEDGRGLGNLNKLKYYAVLMTEWIKSRPLNIIIQSTINYYENNRIEIRINNDPQKREIFSKKNPVHVNQVINQLLKDIETVLRFKIKNYTINYLKLTDQDDSNWQNYLEYGTSDKTIIELQKIGFDRQVAIELSNHADDSFEFNDEGEIIHFDVEKILSTTISQEARNQINLFI